MSESSYAVGNRVYRGGSNAPTRGTVDPMGYVERERLKKSYSPANGEDSDRRSGLAQNLLNPAAQNNTSQSSPSPSGTPAQSQTLPAPLAPKPEVNEMGSILPRKPLPYDMNAEDERENATYNRNTSLRELAQRRQSLGGQYAESARSVQEQQPQAGRQLLNSFAGRGMAHSSGYGVAVGNQQRDFSNTLSQLQRARDEGFAGLSREENDVEEGYNLSLAEIQKAAARRLAEQAQAGKAIGLDPTPVNPQGPALQPDVAPPQQVQVPQPQPDYSPDDRLRRIAQQIMNQERDFNSVRQSVDRLAGLPAGAYGPTAGDAQYMDSPERIMERLRAIFANRSVSLGQY